MEENFYFEGSETYYADMECGNYEEDILSSAWVSQR
jgi:hypothetical protein